MGDETEEDTEEDTEDVVKDLDLVAADRTLLLLLHTRRIIGWLLLHRFADAMCMGILLY